MAEEKVEVRETAASAAVTVVIDGRRLEVPAGFTILEACREAGSEVPTLCYHPALSPGGHCRLCVVEVADNRNLVPACCTPVSAGLQILTSSQRVREARRGLLRLLLAEHPQDCLTCEKSGECLLQKYAYEYGVGGGGSKASASPAVVPRAFAAGSGQPLPSSEARNPFFLRDTRKCILCGRCVKVCGELQGRHAIALMGRGRQTWVGTPFARPLADPPCTFCGNCVQFCPTGALVPNFRLGRGRSWELQRTETVCEYCGVGCRIRLLTREGRIVGAEGAEGPPNYGLLCVKGRFGHGYLQHPERLKTPLVRRHGELVPASWAEALAAVASGLKRIRERWGPDALAGLASARCTNEENYLFQKLFRAVLGTNNVDHCARLCHAPTLTGLQKAFGSGAMTNSLADLALSRCYLVVGSNTPEAHPGVALQLQRGRRRGARLLVVDPRRTDLAEGADLHLRPRPGTDVALFHALAHVIVTERLYDAEFIRRRTEGFAALARAVRRCPPEWAETVTGVPAGVIREAARIYATSSPAAILYAMGVTQYAAGTDRVLALANLALLTGNVGRPGSGVNPLRGQNNVQGACDMGALPDYLPGYAPVGAEEERRRFAEAWGRPLPARPGLALSELAEAMAAGKVRGLYIMGENPLVTEANLGKLEEGLARLELLVVQDLFLTETARRAHVVLPAAALPEKEGTVTSTERRVQLVRPALPPPGEARPDLWILAQLFAHLGGGEVAADPEQVFAELARLVPSYAGMSYRRLAEGGLQWPCPHPEHPGTAILHQEGFPRGRGRFFPVPYRPPVEKPDEEYPFTLLTGRVLYHYHCGSQTRRTQELATQQNAPFVEINPEAAQRLGLQEGDAVWVASRRGRIRARVKLSQRVRPEELFMAFHYAEAPVNRLTLSERDPEARIPELKACAVRLEPEVQK